MNMQETSQARRAGRVVLAGRNWSRRGEESRGREREPDRRGGGRGLAAPTSNILCVYRV